MRVKFIVSVEVSCDVDASDAETAADRWNAGHVPAEEAHAGAASVVRYALRDVKHERLCVVGDQPVRVRVHSDEGESDGGMSYRTWLREELHRTGSAVFDPITRLIADDEHLAAIQALDALPNEWLNDAEAIRLRTLCNFMFGEEAP